MGKRCRRSCSSISSAGAHLMTGHYLEYNNDNIFSFHLLYFIVTDFPNRSIQLVYR